MFVPPPLFECEQVTIVAFSDTSHSGILSHLSFIVGLVIGTIQKGSVIHLLNWASQKSRRPVRSTPAAQILAAGEALDYFLSIRNTLAVILKTKVQLAVVVDSKDFYGSLSAEFSSALDTNTHALK